MRDVTDNVTGELPGVEQKRGRGRPRKAHAMSNAERQAAFRARRKAQQPADAKSVTKRMTVTEMLSDVDAYDECRLEVDALREQLENMRQQCLSAVERHGDAERALLRVQAELEAKQEQVGMLLDRQEELGAELVALKTKPQKSVTPSNGEGPTVDEWIALLAVAMKGKSQITRLTLFNRPACKAVFSKAHQLLDGQFEALQNAIFGKETVASGKKIVMGKA
ncbi:hypothetical protein SAMD00023378_4535 [Ralstonia sp. NT80]|uniref:hypothetical protein n=1 Tax=Ralstonia TaxID=48736 RepID=UPI00076E6803|nr:MULTISPECIES: hypothetical protein [Ralstonia]GAQ30852.1 hypothetical protein SAMD00023378_4535 [Ralstonia sp. NT80]